MSPSSLATTGLLGWLLGMALASLGSPLGHLLPAAARLCPLVLLLFLIPCSSRGRYWLLPLCLLAGYCYTQQWRQAHLATYQYGKETVVTGTVVEAPDVRQSTIFLTVRSESPAARDRQGRPASGTLRVRAERYPLFFYGDVVRVRGTIERPAPFDGFNYPLFLERLGIHAEISRPKSVSLISSGHGSATLAQLYALRDHLQGEIQRLLPEPESSFLEGILLGSKRSIPTDIQQSLRDTGTVHIVVMSGSNITILLELALWLLPLSTRSQQFWATLALSLFVCLLSGAPASVMRGACVACLGRYLRLQSRRAWPTPFLLVAAFLLSLGNPLLLVADPGFQISLAAFAGLVYLGFPISRQLERLRPFRSLAPPLRESLAASLAASLGVAPLSLHFFGQLSFLGLVANPLALWLLGPITGLGLAYLCLSWLPGTTLILRLPLWLLLHGTLSLLATISHLPFGILHLTAGWPLVLTLYVLPPLTYQAARFVINHKPPTPCQPARPSIA